MINKIIRYYNQNRISVIAFIVFIAFIIFLIQSLSKISLEQNKEKYQNAIANNLNNVAKNTININNQNLEQSSNDTNTSNNNTSKNVMDKFIEYCNTGDVEQAYDIISSDCKKIMFPSIERFKKDYYNKIFTSKKSYKIEISMYSGSTYKITYYDDMLSTGATSNNTYEDYIYITSEDGEDKISLNQFIRIKEINKKYNSEDIEIELMDKEMYIGYEIYRVKITNNTPKSILLTSKESSNSINILDTDGTEYSCYLDEVELDTLVIKPNQTCSYKLKFNKNFNANRQITGMSFLDIISNYDEYMQGKEKENIQIKLKL